MTIASEIQRIQTNIANAYDAAEAKGATMPVTENSSNLATTIASISGGGGGGDTITATNTTGALVANGSKVWINKSGNTYSIVNYYGDVPNFLLTNPTVSPVIINNKVASNFDPWDYIQFYKRIYSTNLYSDVSINSMEVIFKVHTPTNDNWTSNGRIINGITSSYDNFALEFNQESGAHFQFIEQGANVNVAPANLLSDTDYWLKITYDGTNLVGSYSTDGVNYTTYDTAQVQPSDIRSFPDAFAIGNRYNREDVTVWNGAIDLSKSYIKINGLDFWRPYLCSVNQESFTGIAKEDIAVSSSGEVSTVLES